MLHVVSHTWQDPRSSSPYLCSLSQRLEPSSCDWPPHTVNILQVIFNKPLHNNIVKIIPTCMKRYQ